MAKHNNFIMTMYTGTWIDVVVLGIIDESPMLIRLLYDAQDRIMHDIVPDKEISKKEILRNINAG